MPASASALARRAARLLPGAALVGAVAFAAWVGTDWWRHLTRPAPAAVAAVPPVPAWTEAAETLASAALFGDGSRGVQVASLAPDLRLKGVFAGGDGRPAAAVVHLNGRDTAARLGGEILPGVKLVAVEPRSITVQRGGALQRVPLDEHRGTPAVRQAQAAPAKPVPAPTPAPAATPAPATSGDTSPARRYRRPDPYAPVGDVSTDEPPAAATPPAPATKPAPGASPRSGVPATDVIGADVLTQLGLQPGDTIRSVNGRPVTNRLELARLAAELRGQPVSVEVGRGDGTVNVRFTAP